jgi:hypothetical protein
VPIGEFISGLYSAPKTEGKGKEEDEEINLWGNLKITTRTFLGLGQRWLQ